MSKLAHGTSNLRKFLASFWGTKNMPRCSCPSSMAWWNRLGVSICYHCQTWGTHYLRGRCLYLWNNVLHTWWYCKKVTGCYGYRSPQWWGPTLRCLCPRIANNYWYYWCGRIPIGCVVRRWWTLLQTLLKFHHMGLGNLCRHMLMCQSPVFTW